MRTIRSLVEGKTCISVFQEDSVAHAVEEMAKYDIGAVPVLVRETNQLIGIFSERDLLKRVIVPGLDLKKTTVRDVMTSQLLAANVDESTEVCMAMMSRNRVRHLIVTDQDKLICMLSMRDLMHAEVSEKLEQIEMLQEYIVGKPVLRTKK